MYHAVGIDSASRDRNCGLALARVEAGRVSILDLRVREPEVAAVVASWVREHRPALIAVDAPLGWPRPLACALSNHIAGTALGPTPNESFLRSTDRFVRARVGKRPLEVGADKIARAAHRSVRLLDELRDCLGLALPLAWLPGQIPSQTAVIEVYPALNLIHRGVDAAGYKSRHPEARERREKIVARLAPELSFGGHAELAIESDDALDAGVCALAAADFVGGNVHEPADGELARQEGWIWFPQSGGSRF